MEALKQRIRAEGKVRGNNEVPSRWTVSSTTRWTWPFSRRSARNSGAASPDVRWTRILTIEASGIAIACLAAPAFGNVPVVFAKKNRTKNIAGDVYISQVESFTQDRRPYNIFVSKEFLHPGEKVLLLDDFLANGSALQALTDLVPPGRRGSGGGRGGH